MEHSEENIISQDIVKKLRMSGHFLHYRMGGKAGRRRILTIMLEQKEILQRRLQDLLDIQSGSLSEIIIKLETEGLVEKFRSTEDGRSLMLKLTPDGIAKARQYKEEYKKRVEQMMSCFDAEEKQRFKNFLDVMLLHWSEIEKDF